ncbi:MAG: hypothetical protein XD93_0146 [candidate division WS6 bacterium 34_10]|uniref:Uncharacterized protein n=1 Tax=candidate division WS6 bacterium 34_10 TaxID=1641389 RepID=A0A101HIY8_9BACT|nr:MAG: hypothetical protein XD93_0146 [candidate division WS6 bacterium 34_10]
MIENIEEHKDLPKSIYPEKKDWNPQEEGRRIAQNTLEAIKKELEENTHIAGATKAEEKEFVVEEET